MSSNVYTNGDWVVQELNGVKIIGFVTSTYKDECQYVAVQPKQIFGKIMLSRADRLQYAAGAEPRNEEINFWLLNDTEVKNLIDMALDTRDRELFDSCLEYLRYRTSFRRSRAILGL